MTKIRPYLLAFFAMCLAAITTAHAADILKPNATDKPESCTVPKDLFTGTGLYLGELHGTQEPSQVVLCLVKAALIERTGSIVVSLELPEMARNFASPFWKGTDGRSSVAMQQLVKQLQDMAAVNPRLSLDFHYECLMTETPKDYDSFVNKCYGDNLLKSIDKGYLIALSGNNHAQRTRKDFMPTAGYLPLSVRTVNIVAVNDGTVYGCYGPDGCHQYVMQGLHEYNNVRGFTPDTKHDYDYIYVLNSMTASPPAL